MEKVLQIFPNHTEAEEAERAYYLSLSPDERLEITEVLRRRYEELTYGSQQRLRRVFCIVKQTPR